MTQSNVLPSKILAKAIPKREKTTKSGIIIAEVVQKDPNISASVVLVGSGVHKILESELLPGHTILFNPHSFQRVVVEDVEYMLLESRDILFYFTPDK